jgi:hypothetical protein
LFEQGAGLRSRVLTAKFLYRQNRGHAVNWFRPFSFEPQEAHGQLPQVVSVVADWQFACAPQYIGGLSSDG